jgi:hypothetical protein
MSCWRLSTRPQYRLLIFVICGMICLVTRSTLGDKKALDGAYSGKRLLVTGPSELCPVKENVSVVIRGDTLTFTNSALKKFTIGFYPDNHGSFGETYTAEGGDAVEIHGHVTGQVIDADVTNYATNPPCKHHWHLEKQR